MPFGVVYTRNLTPDLETDFGKWTKEQFIKTLRTGIDTTGPGRGILPPMPWSSLAQMSDADLTAIWEYLRIVPAIKNQTPAAKVPEQFIANITAGYKAMNTALANSETK